MVEDTCQVFEIVRGTTHDGPGIRTTVFLKGCPLQCSWCHNPEGISSKLEIGWEAFKCIHCLQCIDACKTGAISEKDGKIVRDKNICKLCGACVEICPSHAMDFTSKKWTLENLLKEVLKDYEYYITSGGGVTVSGGEPLYQYEFVKSFFKQLHKHNVHTALDTCGFALKDIMLDVLAYTDLVLFDLKFIDEILHKKHTGKSNKIILQNVINIAEFIRRFRYNKKSHSRKVTKLWIRTPLIPGTTASSENIYAIGSFICKNLLDVVERWELCVFNKACISKYQRLGLKWEFEDTPIMDQKIVDELKKSASSTGFIRKKLVISGFYTR